MKIPKTFSLYVRSEGLVFNFLDDKRLMDSISQYLLLYIFIYIYNMHLHIGMIMYFSFNYVSKIVATIAAFITACRR